MLALDFDLTGNMIVTFYDRRDDSSNIKYHLYSARIDSSGIRLEPNIRVSTFQSNPQNYTVDPRFIGDYHDIWRVVEVRSYFQIAEVVLRTKLYRQETRGIQKREDFPVTDNINWLKWVLVEDKQGEMQIYTRDVPTPYIQPPRSIYAPKHLST